MEYRQDVLQLITEDPFKHPMFARQMLRSQEESKTTGDGTNPSKQGSKKGNHHKASGGHQGKSTGTSANKLYTSVDDEGSAAQQSQTTGA